MRKLVYVILALSLFSLVSAQSAPGIDDAPLVNEIQEGREIYQNLSRGDIQQSYLETEWTKFFRESKYGNTIYKLDPIFKFLFGMEFSFSWKFITGFLIWTIIISIYYPILKETFRSTLPALGIALALSSLTTNFISEPIMIKISKIVKNIWHSLISVFILLILSFLVGRIMGQGVKKWRKWREQKRLVKVEKKTLGGAPELGEVQKTITEAKAMKKGYEESR